MRGRALALVLLGKGDGGRTIPQRFVNVIPQAERVIALINRLDLTSQPLILVQFSENGPRERTDEQT